MSSLPPIIPLIAQPLALHGHAVTEQVLRVFLNVPAVGANAVVEVEYSVPGLLSTDLLFAPKGDVPVGVGSGVFLMRAWAAANVLAVKLGNLLATASSAGTVTLYAILMRPGGGGPPLQIDLGTPLNPLP